MQSGKRLTLKDYFAKHTRVHTRIIKIQMLNCYCQLSSSVIFRQYGVSQSECKIDRPRPGLPRVSRRPHTEALGTTLQTRLTEILSDEESFQRASQQTNKNFRVSGYKHQLKYKHQLNHTTTQTRNRTRNIIWYNPRFSKNVSTSIGQTFLNIIDDEFPADHPLYTRYSTATPLK
jgi:hypothetical protein